ncbi:hypothetical protein SERLA73DRAFT_162482 [Serpula lacrymans var. lacrymans S7.3]|uniref:Calcineurin-like phosphoesterase domain-containing protein n=2 Tax=Serpula lacrymans var. lacrymans TaxID=341189 RepID=F8Q825_SERL3|nr:uncharacterized protein SERLADRAFT_417586 [Serpula lacrymans var. lacrymans S7.9]EGN95713.1 hypothetical protein SERLA73DRAFT_162482 [Serpula lacrymans var. lacrymans S7.3]EGO21236.1 hypothetical protein SERLADRAFT_417586 [Serpula lacrymans var. lacrymans S7.9]
MYSVLVTFVLLSFKLCLVLVDHVYSIRSWLSNDGRPDFDHYVSTKILPAEHIPTNHTKKRIIAVGDIHGMHHSFHSLLNQVSYDPNHDTLVHLGDLAIRSPLSDSLAVLSFLESNNIMGVRGNNDHKIIRWRAWIDWISQLPDGKEWLADVDDKLFRMGDDPDFNFKRWLKHKKSNKKWLKKIPDGWKMNSDHFKVARAMSQDHYEYLASLPLVLHAPIAHTFFVHAGLLAYDVTRSPAHPDQPLSHIPALPHIRANVSLLRDLQEKALLHDIPQNRDPWVLMNMRKIKKGGRISRGHTKGLPWSNSYNDVMNRCSGFVGTSLNSVVINSDNKFESPDDDTDQLPCYPAMVVYGHAASTGLDVKRWSIGLDTGCVYERELTAVILDWKSFQSSPSSDITADENDLGTSSSRIAYGDHGQAQIVSVPCRSS